MTEILVVAGTGAHGDRWHALEDTGRALADVLRPVGTARLVMTDELDDVAAPDLVVADLSGPPEGTGGGDPVLERLLAWHAAGVGLLAVHSSVLAFRDDDRWMRLLGARWREDVSGHPPIGPARILPTGASAAGVAPVAFEVFDERYCDLERGEGDLLVLAEHEERGRRHPLVWWRDGDASAVAVSLLGHDRRAYASHAYCDLVRDLARGLLGA